MVDVQLPSHASSMAGLTSCLGLQPGNRHLWGTDVYTEDSDLVDVLMHAGYIASTGGIATPPSLAAVRVVVQPMVGVKSHAGSLRNRIRSRPWGAKPDGCSFKVQSE